MKLSASKILTYAVTVIAAFMVVMSGIMKFVAPPEMVEKLTEAGVGQYLPILGTMELAFAALFLYPKTMKLGFLLLTCYFAGAIATDLSHSFPIFNAAMVLTLIWIAAFLRDRQVFLPTAA